MTFRALLFLASSPPAPGLTTHSYSCGQEFASGSFGLRLTTRPNLPLRLASSPPSGSFHPDSYQTCQAHERRFPNRLCLNDELKMGMCADVSAEAGLKKAGGVATLDCDHQGLFRLPRISRI